MKKKVVAVCATVALAAVAFGGATLAYFTDQDQVKNNFTIGDISIDLWETAGVKDADGNVLQGTVDKETGELIPAKATGKDVKNEGGFDYTNLMPSYEIVKTPVVQNTGKNDAYVRVAVVMNNVTPINDAIDNTYEGKAGYGDEQIQAIYDEVFEDWGLSYTKRNPQTDDRRLWMHERTGSKILFGGQVDMYCSQSASSYGMFDVNNTFKSVTETDTQGFDYGCTGYYSNAVDNDERIYVFYLKLDGKKIVEDEEVVDGYTLFTGLNAPYYFTADQMKMFKDLEINVYADAIQADGFNDTTDPATGDTTTAAKKAFTALEEAHPLGWWK